MKVIPGGITKPIGFKANGLYCGLKRSGKFDLGLIVSETPATSVSAFTKNSVKAAPLIVSEKHARNGKVQAIIVNSGNANCFTGKSGLLHAEQMAQGTARHLGISKDDVIVASTGIIGKPLAIQKVQSTLPKLVQGLSVNGSTKLAKAILTTDLKIKEITVAFKLGGRNVTIAGCAKGSGMVAPNMATMLGFITTDVSISHALLKKAFLLAVERSFNCITVDGCMSTNDMVTILANGHAENKTITKLGKDYKIFAQALEFVCQDLAKKIVLDAEGATKFIEVTCLGARTADQAKQIGLAVANSVLVKTAAFGSNPNWGRVAAAVGSLGIQNITEKNLRIKFSPFDKKEIRITVNVNLGPARATVYTSDLSYEYVRINERYN